MVTALMRSVLLGPCLALLGLMGAPAPAQTLLDVMGAGAMQHTLQGMPAGGASGVIERSRGSVDQFSQAEQLRLDVLQQLSGGGGGTAPPGALPGPLMEMFRAIGPTAATAGSPQALTTAQVNGRLVPFCSHGGLCYGLLIRAVRGY